MKSAAEWELLSYAIDGESHLIDLVEEIQKEAWNESILLSAESATVTYTSDIVGRHYSVNKQSILKNLIP